MVRVFCGGLSGDKACTPQSLSTTMVGLITMDTSGSMRTAGSEIADMSQSDTEWTDSLVHSLKGGETKRINSTTQQFEGGSSRR